MHVQTLISLAFAAFASMSASPVNRGRFCHYCLTYPALDYGEPLFALENTIIEVIRKAVEAENRSLEDFIKTNGHFTGDPVIYSGEDFIVSVYPNESDLRYAVECRDTKWGERGRYLSANVYSENISKDDTVGELPAICLKGFESKGGFQLE
jgi:hypothetical protein